MIQMNNMGEHVDFNVYQTAVVLLKLGILCSKCPRNFGESLFAQRFVEPPIPRRRLKLKAFHKGIDSLNYHLKRRRRKATG
jgi:hypothetical protein